MSSSALLQKASSWCANAIRSLAILLIEIYRLVLSPMLGGACRFEPSCSDYAQEAFKKHNPGYALFLTLRRLSRCRPLGPSGFDPVPEAPCQCSMHARSP